MGKAYSQFRRLLFQMLISVPLWLGPVVAAAQPSDALNSTTQQVLVLTVDGPIGPATRDYLTNGIEQAERQQAALVLIKMDTPGGLSASMRDIIKSLLSSSVPVATWVGPPGSRAASAGTYILYASHIAAMAPATNLGAATPVPIGGPKPATPAGKAYEKLKDEAAQPSNTDDKQKQPAATGDKALEDSVAYIRALAEQKNRNADWAESAVRNAATLTAEQALANNVIEYLATDELDLIQQLDGQSIVVGEQTVKLSFNQPTLEHIEPNWQNKLLATITNPTLAYILLMIGVYGLILEGYNPGALVPGVVGGISLLLALYAFQILPVNYAGLALIFLGFALIAVEFFLPSFGILGIGGLIALVFGSVILMDTDVPGFSIPLGLILSLALTLGLLFIGLMYYLVGSLKKPIVSGIESLLGQIGEVVNSQKKPGLWVHLDGEQWQAKSLSQQPYHTGDEVVVERVEGLTLYVKHLEKKHE